MVFFIVQVRIKEYWLACTFLYLVSRGGLSFFLAIFIYFLLCKCRCSTQTLCALFSVVHLVAVIQNKSPSGRQMLLNIVGVIV